MTGLNITIFVYSDQVLVVLSCAYVKVLFSATMIIIVFAEYNYSLTKTSISSPNITGILINF